MQNNDDIIYAHNVSEYRFFSSVFDYTEVRLNICGEIDLGNSATISTNKNIPLSNIDDVVKTYQKVIEIRELTSEEMENVSKAKLLLKKMFEVFFRGKKFNLYYCLFLGGLVGFDIAFDNYLGAVMMVLISLFYISPIQFYKEVRKILFKEKRVQELTQYLIDNNLLSLYCTKEDDIDISLYLKPKISQS